VKEGSCDGANRRESIDDAKGNFTEGKRGYPGIDEIRGDLLPRTPQRRKSSGYL
jgi:hypothetical protein